MARVEIDKLTKVFEERAAVDQVEITVEDREFCVLVGPSGCGKTTLLRMVAGLEQPTAGAVLMNGRHIDSAPPGQRDMAMVFQNYALFAHMSVYDNLAWGMRVRKTPKPVIEQRVREAAEMLGITPLLKRKPAQLSGGERQRIALGRALVRQPQVYLMDEPLSNLDAMLRIQMRAEILRLARDLEATVIYVTHDQSEALSMADRLVVMRDGRVQQIGRPHEVYGRPANRFVASFIGSPMMNFIEGGRVERRDGTAVFRAGEFELPLSERVVESLPRRNGALPAVLGIRPEDINIRGTTGSAAGEATVDLVQFMGASAVIDLNVAGHTFVALTMQDAEPSAGARVPVMINERRIHFFDPESGENLFEGVVDAADL